MRLPLAALLALTLAQTVAPPPLAAQTVAAQNAARSESAAEDGPAPGAPEARDAAARVSAAVEGHALPRFARLAAATAELADAARALCGGDAGRAALDAAYHAAFDAWMGVAHLSFGPLEADGRGAAIAFWPDARGATPRTLARLLADRDAAADDPAEYAEVSIAARGLTALDWLMFDADAPALEGYACRLVAAVSADLAATAAAVDADWRGGYAAAMEAPDGAPYRDADEALTAFYRAFATGLEGLADLRLGRPMGDGERVWPRKAEAWRSGRPLRNIRLALAALDDLAARAFIPALAAEQAEALRRRLDGARAAAEVAPAPMAAALETAEGLEAYRRLRIQVALLRDFAELTLAPALGVGLGFNALDGD